MNKISFVRLGAIALIAALSLPAAGAATTVPIRVALGGADASPFVPDTSLPYLTESGADNTFSSTDDVVVSKAKDPAPKAIYQSERYGSDMTFTISGLAPKTHFSVRLHFVENCLTSEGSRIFDVLINKKSVLTQFDIFKDAGGKNIADIKTFDVDSDDSGKIAIEATAGNSGDTDNALLNAIEILSANK